MGDAGMVGLLPEATQAKGQAGEMKFILLKMGCQGGNMYNRLTISKQ